MGGCPWHRLTEGAHDDSATDTAGTPATQPLPLVCCWGGRGPRTHCTEPRPREAALLQKEKVFSVSKEAGGVLHMCLHTAVPAWADLTRNRFKTEVPGASAKKGGRGAPTGSHWGALRLLSKCCPWVPLHTLHSIAHIFCLTWNSLGHRTAPSSKHKTQGLSLQGCCTN